MNSGCLSAQEYPGVSKAAILTPSGSTYLCEKTFSSLAYIKKYINTDVGSAPWRKISVSQYAAFLLELTCYVHGSRPTLPIEIVKESKPEREIINMLSP